MHGCLPGEGPSNGSDDKGREEKEMMSGIQYNGFQNLVGRIFGTLTVVSLASRQPVMWQVRCTCGSSWKEVHTRLLTNPRCRNAACGREVPTSPSAGRTMVVTTAVWSSDSVNARQFARAQRAPSVQMHPSAKATLAADPDSVCRYLDSLKK
jgi:hypothetical protein